MGTGQARNEVIMDKTQLKEALQRIAKMEHAGVPANQIATAFNLDAGKLAELQQTPRYKEELAAIAAESFEKIDVMNEGWDIVENVAMNKVVEHLQRAPDPDYALKAAALANKAQRRGRHTNEVIGQQPNAQAVINVNLQFADKLQETFVIEQEPVKELIKKDDNFLPPKAVNQLLQKADHLIKPKLETEVADELEHMDLIFAQG